ncbi:MAG TPA: hypothetical protein VGP33_12580 [Chloroflexota bacterium]|nr:hypothetical protein [Chloroflexota bacterium]
MAVKVLRPPHMRVVRSLIVATLVVLTAQGWFGDTANIFLMPANGVTPPAQTLSGFLGAVQSIKPPFILIWHTFEGIALVILAIAVFVTSLFLPSSRGVRIWSGLGLLAMLSAALGGYRFVLSGFADGANSAAMGGSYILAYACFFLTLYYTK